MPLAATVPFLEIVKWAVGLGLGLGSLWGAYVFAKTGNKRQKLIAQQLLPPGVAAKILAPGADDVEPGDAATKPTVHEHVARIAAQLMTFGARLDRVPDQINTAVVGVEDRLSGRFDQLARMDSHLMKQFEVAINGQAEAKMERQEIVKQLEVIRRQGVTTAESRGQHGDAYSTDRETDKRK